MNQSDWWKKQVSKETFSKFSEQAKNALDKFGDSARDLVDNIGDKTHAGTSSLSRLLSEKLDNRKSSSLTTERGDIEDLESAQDTNSSTSLFGTDWASELSLTRSQRLVGFLLCFVAGAFMLFFSILILPTAAIRPAKFALSFTFGNLLAIFSTAFLVGPYRQLQYMFKPVRLVATCVYLTSLFMAIFFSVTKGKFRYPLVMLSVVIEIGALLWYSASYIPFGQRIISSTLGSLVEW
eukprot:jgi/Galph1/1000/GphlegSOOS_G5852.1